MDLTVLATGFHELASRFRQLGRETGSDPLRRVHLQEEAGQLLISAMRDGCLRCESATRLLKWYDGADLTEIPPNQVRHPYNVWLIAIGSVLSEIQPDLISFGRSLEYYRTTKDPGHLRDFVHQELRQSLIACKFFAELFEERKPFPFSRLQDDIWDTLHHRALKKDDLAAEVCGGDGSRLYRKNGVQEMRAAGCICHAPGVGFFRPDAPPERKRMSSPVPTTQRHN